METKQLGKTGVAISAIGLGGMPMSLSSRPPEAQAIETIHRALDLGVTLIDTVILIAKTSQINTTTSV